MTSFLRLDLWSKSEWSYSRCVWLECHGLPRHAWSVENLHKISEVWGSVIDFDENSVNGKSFSFAKILIDTCIRHFIKG